MSSSNHLDRRTLLGGSAGALGLLVAGSAAPFASHASAAAPTAFVPTDLLRAVPLRDALEARMAWEAHARDGADDGDDQRDADKMRQLISLLSW